MRVTESLYHACYAYLGEHRAEPLPEPYELVGACAERLPQPTSCVYVVGDADGEALYVGSIHRAHPSALQARLREHLSERRKARTWRRVWVLPVRSGTPRAVVRALEGRVGRRLAPTDQRRLPRY